MKRKPYRRYVILTTDGGVKQKVNVSGPVDAVNHVLRMLALGLDAHEHGLTEEVLAQAKQEAKKVAERRIVTLQ